MRRSLMAICYALPVSLFAQFAPPAQQQVQPAPQQQQQQQNPSGLLGGWRRGTQATPNAAPGQPTVTFPQRQQQTQPVQPPYVPPVGATPAVQAPLYNQAATPVPPAPTAAAPSAATPRSGSSASASSASSSSSRNSSSGSSTSSKPSSSSSSSSSKSSSGSSSSSSSSTAKKSDSDSSKSSDKSSALEKIVKKVDGNESEKKTETKPAEKKETPAPKVEAPKKSKEEIEYEKAQAEMARSADAATTVVASFLKNANDGLYSKAAESLTPEIQKYFESDLSAVNGSMKSVIDAVTHSGTLKMVMYTNTTVRGEGARVEAELGFEDGTSENRSFDLIKIKNDWRIVLPVGPKAAPAAAPAAQPTPAPAPPVAAIPTAASLATETTSSVPPVGQ